MTSLVAFLLCEILFHNGFHITSMQNITRCEIFIAMRSKYGQKNHCRCEIYCRCEINDMISQRISQRNIFRNWFRIVFGCVETECQILLAMLATWLLYMRAGIHYLPVYPPKKQHLQNEEEGEIKKRRADTPSVGEGKDLFTYYVTHFIFF